MGFHFVPVQSLCHNHVVLTSSIVYSYTTMKYLTPLFLFAAVTVPNFVFAVDDPAPGGLVTCTEGGGSGACDWCDFVDMVQLINIWLVAIVGLIAVILIMYAGYRIASSRGEVGVVTEGRKMIGNVAIGIFILILATTIMDVILQTATGKDFGVWNKPFECGESFGGTEAAPVGVELGDHDGVRVDPDANDPRSGVYIPQPSNQPVDNNGFGNDSLGEFGDGTGGNPNNPANNNDGYGNDPLGEFGDGTGGRPAEFVIPNTGPR